ncbi:MAG: amino acid ABC transporter substrate-binding protein [Actinobacteria bacterium]|nr:MAG: amino acid ABC transporter substrate-binding protein [Actinomycetota bacterium]
MPLRTTARITAFSPGQSPPPVRTPMRISRPTYPRRRWPRLWVLLALLAAAAGGCGSTGVAGVPKGAALTVYSSLPRAGVSARVADAIAAGERLALADAHGRVAGRAVRLVELDSAVPGGQAWDPATVEANARRAVDDRTAIAYMGELGLGASAVSVPVTSGDNLLQVSPGDGLTTLTRADPAEPEELPARYYHGGRRNFVRLVPTDAQQAAAIVAWAHASGANRLAIVRDDELFGRELAAEAAVAAPREHVTVTTVQEARHGVADYSSLARDVALRSPEAVLYTGLGDPDAVRLLNAIGRALPGAPVYGSSALATSPDGGGPPADVLKPAAPPALYGSWARGVLRRLLDAIRAAGRHAGNRAAVAQAALRPRTRRSVLGTYRVELSGDAAVTRFAGYRRIGGTLTFLGMRPVP